MSQSTAVLNVSIVDANALAYWRSLPPLVMMLAEFKKLPEYSATNPTGVTPGKRWRRHNGAHDQGFKARGGIPRWVICEYQEAPSGKVRAHSDKPGVPWEWKTVEMCKTVTFRPVIRVKALLQHEVYV